MKQIYSQNEMAENTIKGFFVPSVAAWFLFFLLSGILLLIYTFSQILDWFGNDSLRSTETFNQSLQLFNSRFGSAFDSALGGRLGQVIIWSFVGALVYILIWFVKNMFNSVENDLIIDRYDHPKNYDRTKFFGVAIGELMLFMALLVVLAFYTYAGFNIIMPATAGMLSSSINKFLLPNSLLAILLSIVIPTLGIYAWSIIAKLMFRLWQRL
jgi:hypothetical protein